MAALPPFKPNLERMVNKPVDRLLGPDQKLVNETREPLPILRVDTAPNILHCSYEGLQATLVMWADERPSLPGRPGDAPYLDLQDKMHRLNIANVVQPSCPPTLRLALDTMFGGGAWGRYDTLQRKHFQGDKREAELAAQAERQAAADTATAEAAIKRETSRCEGQLAPAVKQGRYSAEDAAAYCAAHAQVAGIESRVGRNSDLFQRTVDEQIMPKLRPLVESAQSSARQLPAKDRAAYERWQNGSTALAMDIMMRLLDWWSVHAYTIASKASLLDHMTEVDTTAGMPYNPVAGRPVADLYKDLVATQARLVQHHGMFEPVWHRRILSDLRALPAEPTMASPGKPAPTARESRPIGGGLVFLTPGQYAAASFGRSMGQAFGSLAAIFVEVAKARERAKELTARIERTSRAFWTCEARRCSDGGRLMGEYVLALTEADINDSMELDGIGVRTPHTDPRDSRQWAQGIAGCGRLWRTVEDAAKKIDAQGHKGVAGLERLLATPAYADYAACRDQAEYLARPRFILSGE